MARIPPFATCGPDPSTSVPPILRRCPPRPRDCGCSRRCAGSVDTACGAALPGPTSPMWDHRSHIRRRTLGKPAVLAGDHLEVHPQIRAWLETLGAPDVVLGAMIERRRPTGDSQHLRVAIARRMAMTVAATRHAEDINVEPRRGAEYAGAAGAAAAAVAARKPNPPTSMRSWCPPPIKSTTWPQVVRAQQYPQGRAGATGPDRRASSASSPPPPTAPWWKCRWRSSGTTPPATRWGWRRWRSPTPLRAASSPGRYAASPGSGGP